MDYTTTLPGIIDFVVSRGYGYQHHGFRPGAVSEDRA
jgi:hypothetical protein